MDITVILITVLLFIHDYRDFAEFFWGENFIIIGILIITVLLVHIIKALRLYLALYGSEIDFISYIKTYCKVTPITVVIPFKLGEFFRMYVYGRKLNHALKGIIIILLDRFMDTIALVTAILFVWFFRGGDIIPLVYILLLFLIAVLLLYFLYPGIYKFWKNYLLKAKASPHRLAMLKILEIFHNIYQEIQQVVAGRGTILYFMSLTAWGIEIGSLAILNHISKEGNLDYIIADYLTSAMSGNQIIALKRFIFLTVILFIILYFIIFVHSLWIKHKIKNHS